MQKLNINIDGVSTDVVLPTIFTFAFSPFHSFINILNLLTHGGSFIVLGRLFQTMLSLKANELVP